MNDKEVAIIGGGPAGVSASIYLKRYGMSPVLFEKELIGGKTNFTERIENYPGYLGETGPLLSDSFEKQLTSLSIKPIYKEVTSLTLNDDSTFHLKYGKEESDFRYVILANGLKQKEYHLPGEEKFARRGFSSCAICDGAFYKGKNVLVIGAGNAGFEEACYLAEITSHVYLLARHENFRAHEEVVNRFKSYPNTTILVPYEAISCDGEKTLEKVTLRHKITGEEKVIEVNGLFVYIGAIPTLDFVKIDGFKDEHGFAITDNNSETKIKNLFAVGDCRNTPLRQIVSATSDGALAATIIHQRYLNKDA